MIHDHAGRGSRVVGGVVIFTLWCFMVLPTKISCHCAGPLACLKYFSHPWGRVWSCNIHSMVLHGASNQGKLSLCRSSRLF